MTWLLAGAGLLLLALTIADLVKTTLTLQGAGPITRRIGNLGWTAARRLDSGRGHLLPYAGPLIALLTVAGWLLSQWIAWTLFLSAGETMVVDGLTAEPADLWSRIYYAGFSLLTLGIGDYRPSGVPAQLATTLAAALGFLTVSLSATYFIPTVSAAAAKRQLALHISGIGRTPEEILLSTWNGSDFSSLADHLVSLTPQIIKVGQQHLAYPVLHYFYSEDADAALTVRLAALDDALSILHEAVAPDCRPPIAITRPAMNGISSYLSSLSRLGIEPAPQPPPLPSLEGLRRHGIPVLDDPHFCNAMNRRSIRRRTSLALVEDSGRLWSDVSSVHDDKSG